MPDGQDQAKTPEQLEADAKAADEALGTAAKHLDDIKREETEPGHEMADALNMMVGATRVDREPEAQRNMADAYTKAVAARQAANWARRALAYGLTLAGTAMLVAGVAGVGNAAPAAAPAPSAGTTTAAPSGSAAANKPPVVGPIVANLIPTNTFYNVTATDPEGDKLTYVWTKSNPCGPFTFQDGTAVWAHPHPPCPNEEFHPGTITVVITDGHGNTVTRTYDGGSQTGTGTVPSSPPTASPTPFPTTTTRDTPTASAGPSTPPTGGGGGPNIPLAGGGLVVAGVGAGLITQERKKKKTCDDEKAEEARTARELQRAKDAFDEINQTRNAMNYADQRARDADRAAATAARGVPTGAVSGGEMHFIGPKAGAAQAAKDAAQGAHDEAGWKHRDFDAKGGQAAWQSAKDALDAATRAHDAAAQALAACLESIAPPPPPPPPPPPTTGGGTTTSGGTTVSPPPTVSKPKTRQCDPENSERTVSDTVSATITIIDMSGTQMVQSGQAYEGKIDIPSITSAARTVMSLLGQGGGKLDKISPDAAEGMAPMGPILDFTGKMTEAALHGLDQLHEKWQEYSQDLFGTWALKTTGYDVVLHCITKEKCVNGDWVRQAPQVFVETKGQHPVQSGGDDGRDQVGPGQRRDQALAERSRILDRLYRDLSNRSQRAQNAMKAFQDNCK